MARLSFVATSARSLRGHAGCWSTYYDAVMLGLELRISPRGARSWSVRCRHAGRQVRVSLGPVARVGLAQARAKAREALERAARGEDPRRPRGGALTVEALALAALASLELRESTRTEWQRLLAVEVAPVLGRFAADQLDRHAIRRWVDGIRSRAVARAAFAFLRRCYSWGVRSDLLRGTPFVELPGPEPAPASSRVLTTEELRCLWLALGTLALLTEAEKRPARAYVDATRLLILTAARREMIIGMRRSELEALKDPAAARWIVPAKRMKGGRDHVVPLAPQAVAIVERRLESGEDLLFPAGRHAQGPMTWSSRFVADLVAMTDLIAGRKLPAWRIHGLRSAAATHMVEDLGVSSEVVSLILAHRPPGAAVTHVYQRAERLTERRDALSRWASWMEALSQA